MTQPPNPAAAGGPCRVGVGCAARSAWLSSLQDQFTTKGTKDHGGGDSGEAETYQRGSIAWPAAATCNRTHRRASCFSRPSWFNFRIEAYGARRRHRSR